MAASPDGKTNSPEGTARTVTHPPPPAELTSATLIIDPQQKTAAGAAATLPAAVPPAELKPGERFGKYTIERKLGAGAMGAVYLARDATLDRHVALKIPTFRPQDGQEIVERFYREARAMATLRHANLCPVYEVDQIEGRHYLTMAFIEGRPLSDLVRQKKKLPPRSVAAVLRKLAIAIGEAHDKGIVHRDLKPANIMVDERNEPIVMDFGLALRRGGQEAELTQVGQILGSPAYMSPEQVAGDPKKIGPRADIYALGVILFQMLTGRLPYEGPVVAVLGRIMSSDPSPRPSEIDRQVDPELESICVKAMAKDPAERFATAADLAEALWGFVRRRGSGDGERTSHEKRTQVGAAPPPSASAVSNEMQVLTRELFDQLSAEAVRRESARTRRRLVLMFLVLVLLGAAGWAGWKWTDKGQLLVQSYDPRAVVTVKREGRPVDEFEVLQRPGSSAYFSGGYEVAIKPNQPAVGARVRNGRFVLTRGQVVIVEVIPPDYRDVAMFVIEHKGLVFIVGEQQVAATIAQLPPGEFQIRRLDMQSTNDGQLKQLVDKMVEMKQAPDVHVADSPQVTNAGVKEFTRVPSLQGLAISGAGVTDDGVKELASLPNLKSLELDRVAVGDEGFAAVAEKAKSLERLVATKTQMTDQSLESLKQLPNLQSLEIDSPMVTDAGIKQLAEYPALKSVEIRDNPNISQEGVAALGQMKELEHLGLAGSAVKDEHVAELAKSKSLRELDLSRTQVTDLGLIPLKDSKLEKVELAETRVSEHGAAFVQNALIHCQVDSRFTPSGKAVGVARAATESVEAKQRQRAYADEKKMPVEFTNGLGMKFRLIPPGEFVMGSAESEIALLASSDPARLPLLKAESPRHKVKLTRPFYLGAYEVTQTQFQLVMKGNPTRADARDPLKPVGMVPWNTAVDFCNKLSLLERLKPCYEPDGMGWKLTADGDGYRLPTEAEWEFACRAGTSTAFSFADSAAEVEEYGWAFNLSKGPERIGLKAPNAFGLFDMYGNHWEWVEDLADVPYAAGDAVDPRFANGAGNRVTRGGAYYHNAFRVRSAAREPSMPHMTYPAGGFRVALVGQPPAKPDSLVGGLLARPARRSHLAPRDEPSPDKAEPGEAHRAERDGYAWQVFTRSPRGGVSMVKWSGDGKSIAAFVQHELAVRIYDVASNSLRGIVPGVEAKELAWSPDGQQLAVLVENAVVVGRLGESSCQVQRLAVPVERLLSWSPDGQWITAAGFQSVVLIKPDGSDIKSLDIPGYVESVSWSPFDASVPETTRLAAPLLAASTDKVVTLWNADGTPGPVIKDGGNPIAWHPTGRLLATPSSNNSVRVWNVDGTESATLPDHNQGVEGFAFSPTGQGIVTSSRMGQVSLWSLKPGEPPTRVVLAEGAAGPLFWPSPQHVCIPGGGLGKAVDSLTVLTLAADRMSATKTVVPLPGYKGTFLDFEPRGPRYVTAVFPWFDYDGVRGGRRFAGKNGVIQIHDLQSAIQQQPAQQQFNDEGPMPLQVSWNPRQPQFAVLMRDRTIRVYQPDGTPVRIIDNGPERPFKLGWLADGRHLAVFTELGGVVVFDEAGRNVRTIDGVDEGDPPHGLAFACHPVDPNRIAIGGRSGIRLLDWRDNVTPPKDLSADVGRTWIGALAWSRDGKTLASGYWLNNGDFRFWTEDGTPVARISNERDELLFLSWSPDGTMVLGGGWHFAGGPFRPMVASLTQKSLAPLIAAPSVIQRDGVFTPNGRGIAVAAEDGIRLYRIDGQPGPALEFASASARSILFSPDGKQLLAAGKSGIRVWSTQTRQIDRIILPLPNGQSRTYGPTGQVLHTTPHAAAYLTEVVEAAPGEVRVLPSPTDPTRKPDVVKPDNVKPDNQVKPIASESRPPVVAAPTPPVSRASSTREDLVWLQGLKATLTLRSGPKAETTIGPSDAIPAGPAKIVGIVIDRNNGPAVTDDVLKRIATLTELESLECSFAIPADAVTKNGLPSLTPLVNLRRLTLGRIGPADTDPAYLGAFQNLESLSFQYTAYSGWEPTVARLQRLKELWLHNVDKFEPEKLGPLPRLTTLKMTGFPETRPARDAAAKRFAAVIPWCRISLDDAAAGTNPATIEPTAPPPSPAGK